MLPRDTPALSPANQDFMNAAMQYLELAMGPGNPIIRIAMGMDHNFAFAEFRTQEASGLLCCPAYVVREPL